MKAKFWRGMLSVFAVLLCLMIVMSGVADNYRGTINEYLGIKTYKVEARNSSEPADTAYFKSDFGDVNALTESDFEKLKEAAYQQIISEVENGAVLLKNNGALPLTKEEQRVSLFGTASWDHVYKPTSGGADVLYHAMRGSEEMVNLKSALTEQGFSVNETLYAAYLANSGFRGTSSYVKGMVKAGDYGQRGASAYKRNYDLGEPDPAFLDSAEIQDSLTLYGDAVIVVFAREGGEDRDLPIQDYENNPSGESHLALQPNERALMQKLKALKDSGKVKKVIALLNTGYAMEVEWLDEYDVDACLWIGGPGIVGFRGVVNLLTGKTNPSGRLVDTYAADSRSAPAVLNAGNFTYTNADAVTAVCKDGESNTTHYLVYAEGIYVGYKYYETRYEDVILGRGNANGDAGISKSAGAAWDYAAEVSFPFGFGLSYTVFEQTLDSVKRVDEENNHGFLATVTVKNTGSVPGRNAVELYAQTPYTQENIDHKVEKAAIQLVGFNKTDLLAPGASQTLTIYVDQYLLASYDNQAVYPDGTKGGYILDAGDYYFAIGADAHDALNNVLAAKRGNEGLVDHEGKPVQPNPQKTVVKETYAQKDDMTYRFSQYTLARVSNQFDDLDINYWIPGSVTYLSRSDWQGTYPQPVSLAATDDMIRMIDGYTYTKPDDAPAVDSFIRGEDSGLKMIDMRGLDYDDETWDVFLNQLKLSDLMEITIDNLSTAVIERVNKPAQKNTDGPDGVQRNYEVLNEEGEVTGSSPTPYANEVVLASTFDPALIANRGRLLGEDCLFNKTTQLWSPGADVHRTPFAGRNFEYYSEDSYMSYLCAALEVTEMVNKGVNVAIKHFAGNDQETNRTGVCTFMTEQTFRQQGLRGFESAFTLAKTLGTMTAFNRLGCTYAGASDAMQNKVLRGEWGFKGVCITDAAGSNRYQHTIESLVNGSDMFCMADKNIRVKQIEQAIKGGDGYVMQALREANHRFYYAFANSNLANGLDSNAAIVPLTPWWSTAISAAIGVLGVLTAGSFVMMIVSILNGRKKEAKQ